MAPGGRPHYTNDSDDETERARKAFEKVMPGYRMEIRLMPRLSKDAKLAVLLSVTFSAALFALAAAS